MVCVEVKVDHLKLEEDMEFTELDLGAVAKIQEIRNCTHAKAKEIFRLGSLQLANPDAENRAELVLAAIERAGGELASDEEVEATVTKKKPTKWERKQASKAKKEAKKANGKKNGEKKRKAPAKSGTRIEWPLAALDREVELTPVPDAKHVYTTNLFGKKHAVIWNERNRSTGAEARFQSINVSQPQLDAAKKHAKENDLQVGICVSVRVKDKLDQGYAVPIALFEKFKSGESGFNLSGAARKAYGEDGWEGVKFSAVEAKAKAA
jgi:hypothetical protein